METEDILAKLRAHVDAKSTGENLAAKVARFNAATNVREQFDALHSMLGTYGTLFDQVAVLQIVAARIVADAIDGLANELAANHE